jgi:hypothetical protein
MVVMGGEVFLSSGSFDQHARHGFFVSTREFPQDDRRFIPADSGVVI